MPRNLNFIYATDSSIISFSCILNPIGVQCLVDQNGIQRLAGGRKSEVARTLTTIVPEIRLLRCVISGLSLSLVLALLRVLWVFLPPQKPTFLDFSSSWVETFCLNVVIL